MKKTYIFGHRKPDTDAVMSAIALSYLKNKLGENTEPRVLGSVNKETKYVLNYFNLKEPRYLNDVKLQLKDVNYHKNFYIEETSSIYDGYQAMLKEGLTGIPIVDNDKNFIGLITIKDLSHMIINGDFEDLNTSYDNIAKVLKGKKLLKFNEEIAGKIIAATYKSVTFIESVNLDNSNILIVGDRDNIIEYAINSKVKLIVLSNSAHIKEKHLKMAKENKVNIIKTTYDSYHIAKLISFTNYIKTMIRSYNPTRFEETEFVDNILEINNKLKHTNYPVVNKKNKCLGLLRLTDLNDKKPKDVILVDHNERIQSIDGLEEANILEIIDHHNLGNLTTNSPINFRNMSVGSTCTIVYSLFKERNVNIPIYIAGALISGILSDTLVLKSPTTTKLDIEAVKDLANIAKIDYKKYGLEMLKSGTSLENMSKEDVVYNDYKVYTVNEKHFSIGWFYTMNFDEMKKDLDKYIEVLDKTSEANDYSLVALYVTDIIKNGSYVIFNTKGKDIMNMIYNKSDFKEATFIPNCVSRKKSVVPLIMEVFEN